MTRIKREHDQEVGHKDKPDRRRLRPVKPVKREEETAIPVENWPVRKPVEVPQEVSVVSH